MKLPLRWLQEFLEGGLPPKVLADACKRWELHGSDDPARMLATLLTFAGFEVESVEGAGLDAVLDLTVLANRPDCQGLAGLAREVAAILGVRFLPPPCEVAAAGAPAAESAQVSVEDSALCPRYTARVIRGVKVGPSPDWLQARLRSMGLIPRNNIVDVTNYVLFELNQPLHAFDLNKLDGRRIVVRRARDKEAFKPLYGELPPLTAETLVIADAQRPVAIGGIIGGAGSEVSPETVDILLESAYFDPANTRRTCRRLKVGTDSSYRFERGIDADAVAHASARAARLIAEVAGGAVAPGLIDTRPQPRAEKPIELRFARLESLYGVRVPPAEARRILETLGCTVREERADKLVVLAPTWRRGDLEREADLIEEVARLYGYHRIPAETAMRARIPNRSQLEIASERVRDHCTGLGYFECWTDTLVDPRWPAPPVWTTAAPLKLDPRSVLREDHSALRNALATSLLSVARHNQAHRTGTARLFELGKIFLPHAGAALEERRVLGIYDAAGFAPLADTLGRLSDALELDGARLALRPAETGPDWLAPDSACRLVRIRETGDHERAENPIGWLGLAGAALLKAFDLRGEPAYAELDLEALAHLPTGPRRYRPLPTQPEVVRDVAVVVSEDVLWHDIESFAQSQAAHEPLRAAGEPPRFLSAYRGKQLGPGRKSLAFSVVYRHRERSLTDEEVNAAHERFVAALLPKFNAELRK
ncbi:MAG: phenylalanine--tRNA ligase beta subunit [Planctomycetota bacterium]